MTETKQDDTAAIGGEMSVAERAKPIFGTDHEDRAVQLLYQVASTVSSIVNGKGELIDSATGSAAMIGAIAELAPRDEGERMLVAQMFATHEAAMECFRRAMLDEQSFEGRDMNLKHAEKLVGLYARQLEALDKHRGKGKQKITVEHVNVHAGGQAIVGDVNATKSDASPRAGEPRQVPTLADESAAAEDGEKLREALREKKKPSAKRARK